MFTYLEKHGITFETLTEESRESVHEKDITNGLIVDLYNLAKQKCVEVHTELPIWISKICNLDKNAINSNALMCKIHRTMKTSKTKRGERKRAFLDMKFSVPVQTQSIVTETSTSAIFSKEVNEPVHNKDMKKTEEKLFERRSKVKELTEKNKQLKRKYERMLGKQEAATVIKKKKDEELSESKSELKQLKKTITKFRAENQNVQKTEG